MPPGKRAARISLTFRSITPTVTYPVSQNDPTYFQITLPISLAPPTVVALHLSKRTLLAHLAVGQLINKSDMAFSAKTESVISTDESPYWIQVPNRVV